MKYLVNRKTKEHVTYDGGPHNGDWYVIEADSEGWIKHDGGECPLPDGVVCQWKAGGNGPFEPIDAGKVNWEHGVNVITHYRPILNDKPVKSTNIRRFENVTDTTSAFPLDLLDRLKSAHKAASELPDIIAELRDTLGPEIMEMLCEAERCNPDEPFDRVPDMTDWRNWREGDKVLALYSSSYCFKAGSIYTVKRVSHNQIIVIDGHDDSGERGIEAIWSPDFFRFHSRPTKEANNV